MKASGNPASLWRRKDEGFLSIFAKLLYLILVYGLVVLLILDKTGSGTGWIFARFPVLEVVRDVSPAGLYLFWLVSLWIGYMIGKHTGLKRGASRERKRLGIPF